MFLLEPKGAWGERAATQNARPTLLGSTFGVLRLPSQARQASPPAGPLPSQAASHIYPLSYSHRARVVASGRQHKLAEFCLQAGCRMFVLRLRFALPNFVPNPVPNSLKKSVFNVPNFVPNLCAEFLVRPIFQKSNFTS